MRTRNRVTKGWILKRIRLDVNGCWIWDNGKDRDGYGLLIHRKKKKKVHRVTYMLWVGRIPKGLSIRHTCDVTRCCNPEHLLIGTHTDNMKDMYDRGRAVDLRGEGNPMSKLTDKAIRHIRNSDLLQRELGEIYSVSNSLVSMVQRGKIWKHVSD